MKTPHPSSKDSMTRLLLRSGFLLFTTALVCLALSPPPKAFGVTPTPDGGYSSGNTAEGTKALFSLTTGVWNTALGQQSLYHVTSGTQNTAVGYQTLFSNITGSLSTAYGSQSLYNNTTGSFNTATGFRTLYTNTTGSNNTGNGYETLAFNSTGHDNAATGYEALYNNTTGFQNSAAGALALFSNTTGNDNTASGFQALYNNTTGLQNTAMGVQALLSNTFGNFNTAVGDGALYYNTTGVANIALGVSAGLNVTTANSVICIGTVGQNVSNTCFIGNIHGVTTQNNDAIPVLADSAGQLGTASSSQRYKTDIKPMNKASEVILALKPVSFRYKVHKDTPPQFGLIAEQVAEVSPDLVIYDADGKPYTVRYDAVNAMLLNEFLKEHRTVQELKSTVASQDVTIARQQKQIKALTAGLQKVSDQLALSKPALQIVGSSR